LRDGAQVYALGVSAGTVQIAFDNESLVYAFNSFAYAKDNPYRYTDPFGLAGDAGIPDPNAIEDPIPGGPWYSTKTPGVFEGPKQPFGPKRRLTWVPEGGKNNSIGYWHKTLGDGETKKAIEDQRYDQRGKPIAPEEAHPGFGRPESIEGGGGGGEVEGGGGGGIDWGLPKIPREDPTD
jgi:hypothetical protein